ncbi:MAG: hypothetical protein C0625_08025 [Arcobacter sp.]|nr:MAG: hypothetical protein C0625_08025 [Arcobacter sp.]
MNKPIKDFLYRIGSEVANEAKDKAPYRTGNLKRDIQVFTDNLDDLEVSIGNTKLAPYAIFVHTGTGLFGPKKKRITPKNKKALKTPFGLKKSVAGMRADPYLESGASAYLSSGGFNRAVDDMADDVGDQVFKDVEKALRDATVSN